MVDTKSEYGDAPFVKHKKMECNFSKQVLKSLVGIEKAERALKSISMGELPTLDGKSKFSFDCKLTSCC
jgi:hypothetical protein